MTVVSGEQVGTGLSRAGHPSVVGSVIGAAGATSFVLGNRSELTTPWPLLALLAWAVLLVTAVWAVLLCPRRLADPTPPRPRAIAVYVGSVLGMIAAIALGHAVLVHLDHAGLQPVVVVIAVGLHFVPFAATFEAPIFGRLGWSMAALGLVGLVSGWAAGDVVARGVAVIAGLLMLAFIAHAAWADRDGAA